MILCCAIPLLGILTLSSLGVLGSWGYYAMILICPLGHIFMMRGMHSTSKNTTGQKRIEYIDDKWSYSLYYPGNAWLKYAYLTDFSNNFIHCIVAYPWQKFFRSNATKFEKTLDIIPQCGYKEFLQPEQWITINEICSKKSDPVYHIGNCCIRYSIHGTVLISLRHKQSGPWF